MAAINAIVNTPEKSALNESDAPDAFDYIEQRGQGANVAVVGHFPKVDKMRQSERFDNFWVFELEPRGDDLGPDQYEEYLPRADFVLLTATSLINGSFARMVSLCRDSFTLLVGPSAPLHPVLFEHGIDCIAGSVVTDKERARLTLSQGASFRYARGLTRIAWFKER